MLGQALMREARRRGLDVCGASRSRSDYRVDIRDDAGLVRMLDETAPRVVVNCAAITDLNACEADPGQTYAVNARAVSILAEHCALRGIHLVQISTDHYFTGDAGRKHDEDAAVRLVNEYARCKYAGERFALTCAGSLVVRTNVVGFRGWQHHPTFVEWALNSLKSGAAMTLFSDFYTSSIDVEHFASALFDAISKRATGVLNIASREVSSKQTFIEALARAVHCPLSNAKSGSVTSVHGAPRAESLGLDVGKAEELLGYRFPGLDEVIVALTNQYAKISI